MQKRDEESVACALTKEWHSTVVPIPGGRHVGMMQPTRADTSGGAFLTHTLC